MLLFIKNQAVNLSPNVRLINGMISPGTLYSLIIVTYFYQ